MDSSGHSSRRPSSDASPRPPADHPAQQPYGVGSRASADDPEQPPDLRRRPPGDSASFVQGVPDLPDESTIRARPPVPTFRPFYSLVSDIAPPPASLETCYPRVRYIFSDDDPDLLAEALASGYSRPGETDAAGTGSPVDRPLLLDLAATPDGQGYTVASATSLSPNWAVTSAVLRQLEPGPSGGVAEDEGSRTMVLDIEGLSIPSAAELPTPTPKPSPGGDAARAAVPNRANTPPDGGWGDYGDLVRAFETRMALLKKAVHNAEESRKHYGLASESARHGAG